MTVFYEFGKAMIIRASVNNAEDQTEAWSAIDKAIKDNWEIKAAEVKNEQFQILLYSKYTNARMRD